MDEITTDTDVGLVAIDRLAPSPLNPRRLHGALADLADSIAQVGILEPLVVRPHDEADGDYEVVAGHRRLAALHRLADADDRQAPEAVPCVVRDLTDEQAVQIMVVENMQRADLSPAEEARGLWQLQGYEWTVTEIADKIGRSQAHARSRLKLLELPDPFLDAIDRGEITLGDVDRLYEVFTSDAWEVLLDADDDELARAGIDNLDTQTAEHTNDSPHRVRRWVNDAAEQIELRRILDRVKAKAEDAGVGYVEQTKKGYRWTWPAGTAEVEDDLNIDAGEHRSEPCHALGVRIKGSFSQDPMQTVEMCTTRSRHTKSGASDVKPRDFDKVQAAKQRKRQERERRKARQQVEDTALAEAAADLDTGRMLDAAATWLVRELADTPTLRSATLDRLANILLDDGVPDTDDDGDKLTGYARSIARREVLVAYARQSRKNLARVAAIAGWLDTREYHHDSDDRPAAVDPLTELVSDYLPDDH